VSLLKKRLRTDNPQKQWLGILLFQKVSCKKKDAFHALALLAFASTSTTVLMKEG
jgi:hypothetical protein